MTTQPPPPDEPSSIPDDVWEKFGRDSEAAIRATAPKEPSARARMVAGRLRHEEGEPEGWRAGPSRPRGASERRGRWCDRLRSLLIAVSVGAIAFFALNPHGAMSLLKG